MLSHEVEIESVKLLQTRLDRIKRRHDALEPKPPSEIIDLEIDANPPLTPVEGGMPRSRSTITMVQDSPHNGSLNKAERLLGLGFGTDQSLGTKGEIEETTKIGKAGKWFKKLGGKQKKRKEGDSPSPFLDTSPNPGGNTFIPYTSPEVKTTPKLSTAPVMPKSMPSSALRSPALSGDSTESTSPTVDRKRPPLIMTTTSSPGDPKIGIPNVSPSDPINLNSPTSFAFEFELPTMSPRSDTFDPSPTPPSPRRKSQPPSPRQPQSPHMSRSFSKRSSLLPPSTASALEGIMAEAGSPASLGTAQKKNEEEAVKKEEEKGYDRKLHAYAIRMLAELEDAQKEVS